MYSHYVGDFSNDVDVPEEVRNLKLADIEPKFDRNRTYDLATKVNSWATLVQNGADLLKATELAGFTTDAQQFVLDSEEMVNKILESKLKGTEQTDPSTGGKQVIRLQWMERPCRICQINHRQLHLPMRRVEG